MSTTDLEKLAAQENESVGVWRRLARMANVLRYYRPRQLVRRGVGSLRPNLLARRPQRYRGTVAVREAVLEAFREIAETRISRSLATAEVQRDDLARGSFTLLNEHRNLGTPIDWVGCREPHPSRLWGFQLHYQEYLMDLAASVSDQDTEAWRIIWRMIASWIAGNSAEDSTNSDAWHPYCVSRRLPIWAQLYALCPPPQEIEAEFLASFATQALWLRSSLEFDLEGNHLVENLRALALAGCFLEGGHAESWLDLADRHLRREIAKQILPTGEHYERTPMYHCQVLGNLLQISIVARKNRVSLAEMCLLIAGKMKGILEQILHPDGEIPLLGDSCFGEVYPVRELNSLASRAGGGLALKPPSGAAVLGDTMIFDAGPVGADSLPAHAHCDLLGFEASIEGERWFVDSGVYDYSESSMRNYCRSSLAHNVVSVNNQNSCDIWSRFRMGRRGRITRFEHGQQGQFAWCFASHDGYRSLGRPLIGRLIVAQMGGGWACVEFGPSLRSADAIKSGELVGRLHLAPEMQVEIRRPQQLELKLHDTVRWLNFPVGTQFDFAQGWYCDRFGRRTRTQVITYQPTVGASADGLFGWWFVPSVEERTVMTFPKESADRVRFASGGEVFDWRFE